MKYLCHVPTEQYGFVSVEVEGTAAEARQAYQEVADAFKPTPVNEMPAKDFQAILDDLMEDHSIAGDPGSLELMSPVQRQIINEVKKSIKRITK